MELRVMVKKNGDKVLQTFKNDGWVNIPQVNEEDAVDEVYVDMVHHEILKHSIFRTLRAKSDARADKEKVNRTRAYYVANPLLGNWEIGVTHEEYIAHGQSIITKDVYTVESKKHSPAFFADNIMKSFIELYIARDIESALKGRGEIQTKPYAVSGGELVYRCMACGGKKSGLGVACGNPECGSKK